ncbi:MAG: hypothetical protein ACTSVF_05565, partial [Candidatus Asgardarchaeia archaeon]
LGNAICKIMGDITCGSGVSTFNPLPWGMLFARSRVRENKRYQEKQAFNPLPWGMLFARMAIKAIEQIRKLDFQSPTMGNALCKAIYFFLIF